MAFVLNAWMDEFFQGTSVLDFTLKTYRSLLGILINRGYVFQSFREFLDRPHSRSVILRHDVDTRPENSLAFARIQHELGIRGTYFFRIVPKSFGENIIQQIANLGHEIGYHYEDMDLARNKYRVPGGIPGKIKEEDLYDPAIEIFRENLEKMRKLYPVTTICMHGSPLSPIDNKAIWKKYNYRDFGIIGEPYFDLDFSKVFYLTDTGRRWDGKGSVRDKVSSQRSAVGGQNAAVDQKPVTINRELVFRHTRDIIKAAAAGLLPDQIMFTFHPQRWTDKPLPWLKELALQNVKNVLKQVIVRTVRL